MKEEKKEYPLNLPCFICGKQKGQPPDRCPGHYEMPDLKPTVGHELDAAVAEKVMGWKFDIEQIAGVRGVSIKAIDGGLEVYVQLDKLEFSVYERVIQKELDLFDQFPDLKVKFDVAPCIARELEAE